MSLPVKCPHEGCFSAVFTREVQGEYADKETLVGDTGEIATLEHFTELTGETAWVCEGGHEQP